MRVFEENSVVSDSERTTPLPRGTPLKPPVACRQINLRDHNNFYGGKQCQKISRIQIVHKSTFSYQPPSSSARTRTAQNRFLQHSAATANGKAGEKFPAEKSKKAKRQKLPLCAKSAKNLQQKFQPAKKSVQWNTTILRSIFQCSALRAVLFKALSRSLNTKTRADFPRRNCAP